MLQRSEGWVAPRGSRHDGATAGTRADTRARITPVLRGVERLGYALPLRQQHSTRSRNPPSRHLSRAPRRATAALPTTDRRQAHRQRASSDSTVSRMPDTGCRPRSARHRPQPAQARPAPWPQRDGPLAAGLRRLLRMTIGWHQAVKLRESLRGVGLSTTCSTRPWRGGRPAGTSAVIQATAAAHWCAGRQGCANSHRWPRRWLVLDSGRSST